MLNRTLPCLVLLLTACGGDDDAGPRSTMTDEQAAQMREACAFQAGTTAGLSLGKDAPQGRRTQTPDEGKVIEIREVGGLHHHYERRVA